MDRILLDTVGGVESFADLTITPLSGGASSLIPPPGGETIHVIGVAPGDLTVDDFEIIVAPI